MVLKPGFASNLHCLSVMKKIKKNFTLSSLIAMLIVAPVFADEIADVSKLMGARQYNEALSKVDAFLNKSPRDAQMRFMKGVILSEQNRATEAVTVFTKLTEDFPDLPEPYNNLAVLYAAAGQYEKARTALETAIRTNPAYATAYENLGDVHARMASQAYDKALQLDSANTAAKSKLTLVRSLVGSPTGNINFKEGATASANFVNPNTSASNAPINNVPVKPALSASANNPPPVMQTPSVARAEPKTMESAQKTPVKQQSIVASNTEREAVLAVVDSWAKAWSAKDVPAYLSYYAENFQTPKNQTHKHWADERTAKIMNKDRITVRLEAPHVSIKGNVATVKFLQFYTGGSVKSKSQKTLLLTRAAPGAKWQIQQEQSGS